MYKLQVLTDRIKSALKTSGKEKDVLLNCGVDETTLNQLSDEKVLSSYTLAKISDELDCSTDYLLGRSDNPQSHKSAITIGDISVSDNSVTGDGQVGVFIHNNTDLNSQTEALLSVFNKLDPFKQAKVLVYVDELSKNE